MGREWRNATAFGFCLLSALKELEATCDRGEGNNAATHFLSECALSRNSEAKEEFWRLEAKSGGLPTHDGNQALRTGRGRSVKYYVWIEAFNLIDTKNDVQVKQSEVFVLVRLKKYMCKFFFFLKYNAHIGRRLPLASIYAGMLISRYR